MKVTFKKHPTRGTIMTITRTDGTEEWTVLRSGMEMHDLAHLALERALSWPEGFYGLVDQGYAIEDFEAPRDERIEALLPKNLPTQALIVEHIVNLLQTAFSSPDLGEPFTQLLARILSEKKLPYPSDFSEETALQVLDELKRLQADFMALPIGETLSFSFILK